MFSNPFGVFYVIDTVWTSKYCRFRICSKTSSIIHMSKVFLLHTITVFFLGVFYTLINMFMEIKFKWINVSAHSFGTRVCILDSLIVTEVSYGGTTELRILHCAFRTLYILSSWSVQFRQRALQQTQTLWLC